MKMIKPNTRFGRELLERAKGEVIPGLLMVVLLAGGAVLRYFGVLS